jgi:hypothetical protein
MEILLLFRMAVQLQANLNEPDEVHKRDADEIKIRV